MKKSILFRNSNFEQDCKKFVKCLDNSLGTNLVFPPKNENQEFIEKTLKSYENTCFERFSAKMLSEPKVRNFIKDENYCTMLYLYFSLAYAKDHYTNILKN